jgi:hypothetical protein
VDVGAETTERENESSASKPSVRLRNYVSSVADEHVVFGDLVRALGDSTPGFVLLVLALPAFIPSGLPIAAPAGAVMIVIGALMMADRTEITIPRWLAHRGLTKAQVRQLVQVAAPVMACLEKFLAPRLAWMLKRRQLRIVGLMVAIDGVLIFLPIPFGNSIPAFAVMVMALGMMLGDGGAVLSGMFVTIIAILIAIAIVALGFEIMMVLFA